MGVDYPGAVDMMLDPNHFGFSSNANLKIVDHCTGGDMDLTALHNNFLNSGKSAHFGIDRNGVVAQFISIYRGAGGNCCPNYDSAGNMVCSAFWVPLIQKYGNLNLCTLSIEHCNDVSNSLPLTPPQQDASNKLNLWLCKKFNLTPADIHSHASIDPLTRARCPGPGFNFQQLFAYINKELNVPDTSEQSIQEHFLSEFVEQNKYRAADNQIPLPPLFTGIYGVYEGLYKKGIELGGATSHEYEGVDFQNNPVTFMNFGSYRVGWTQHVGPRGIWGPTHIDLP
jgi:N-acetyl-anhydromuramyl-L-alanine amidase AmpD